MAHVISASRGSDSWRKLLSVVVTVLSGALWNHKVEFRSAAAAAALDANTALFRDLFRDLLMQERTRLDSPSAAIHKTSSRDSVNRHKMEKQKRNLPANIRDVQTTRAGVSC